MASRTLFLFLASSLLWASSAGVLNGVEFSYPTKGLTFYYLDTVNVTWTSQFPTPHLHTLCKNSSWDNVTMKVNTSVPSSGSSLVFLDKEVGSPCWFDLRPSTAPGEGAISFIFTLLSQRSPTTVGLSPGASETGSSSSTSSSSTSPTSSADPEASSSAPSSGLSGGAKAGIGIGVSLVALGALGSLGAYLLMRRRRKAAVAAAAAGAGATGATNGAYAGVESKEPFQPAAAYGDEAPARQELASGWRGHEMDSSTQAHELPARP